MLTSNFSGCLFSVAWEVSMKDLAAACLSRDVRELKNHDEVHDDDVC